MWLAVVLVALLVPLFYWWWLERPHNLPCPPTLTYVANAFNNAIVGQAVIMRLPYVSPLLWGRVGHLQTFVYSVFDRAAPKRPRGDETISIGAPDGATVTYDIFEPDERHWRREDLTMLVAPGIANSSNNAYISAFSHYAKEHGYRCVVLNHLGAESNVELTAPRIFTYGGTDEFALVVDDALRRYPASQFLLVGFSMGGNIVLKYLGQLSEERRRRFVCAVSLCQGYDIEQLMPSLFSWSGLRRVYNFLLTCKIKTVLRRNRHSLFSRDDDACFKKIDSSTSLSDIDHAYTMRVHGFGSLAEFYRDMSCINHIQSVRDFPILFVNAVDDPLIPIDAARKITDYVETVNEKSILLITRHGGHLGYFEGDSLVWPHALCWVDRLVLQYCDAVLSQDERANGELLKSVLFDIGREAQPAGSSLGPDESDDSGEGHSWSSATQPVSDSSGDRSPYATLARTAQPLIDDGQLDGRFDEGFANARESERTAESELPLQLSASSFQSVDRFTSSELGLSSPSQVFIDARHSDDSDFRSPLSSQLNLIAETRHDVASFVDSSKALT